VDIGSGIWAWAKPGGWLGCIMGADMEQPADNGSFCLCQLSNPIRVVDNRIFCVPCGKPWYTGTSAQRDALYRDARRELEVANELLDDLERSDS
jgi:hypothetical protein